MAKDTKKTQEFTLLQVANITNALSTLKNQPSVKTSLMFRLARTYSKFSEVAKPIADIRQTLIDKYGLKDEAGKPVTGENGAPVFDPEQKAETDAEWTELMNQTEAVDVKPIPVSWLEGLQVTMELMSVLDPILFDDSDGAVIPNELLKRK